MRNLNQKEQAVLESIRTLCKQNGYSPSVRDICAVMGYKSTSTVHMYLDRLAEYGYICRADGKSRSILLCEAVGAKTIRCLRRGVLPSEDLKETDFEGVLPFAYTGELPEKSEPIAVPLDGEWWVILQGSALPEDKPKLFLENGRLTVCNNAKNECIGVVLAVIRQY